VELVVLVIVGTWLVASVAASALFSVLGRGAVQEDRARGYVIHGG
jgi:hypothetical protein